jgi:hypothetical protein
MPLVKFKPNFLNGVVVSVLPLDPRVVGSNLVEAIDF